MRTSQKGDIGIANKRKMNIYVATPNGTLQKYDFTNGHISVISKELPSDMNDPTSKNNKSSIEEKHPMTFEKIQELFEKSMLNAINGFVK